MALLMARVGNKLRNQIDNVTKFFLNYLIILAFDSNSKHILVMDGFDLILLKSSNRINYISAAGYFVLDYNVFLSMLTAIASYIVILIELN